MSIVKSINSLNSHLQTPHGQKYVDSQPLRDMQLWQHVNLCAVLTASAPEDQPEKVTKYCVDVLIFYMNIFTLVTLYFTLLQTKHVTSS